MSTKSAVHIASVPEASTLLFFNFFRIGLCSSSASSLLHSISQPSFLFVPIILRTSLLSIFSRVPFWFQHIQFLQHFIVKRVFSLLRFAVSIADIMSHRYRIHGVVRFLSKQWLIAFVLLFVQWVIRSCILVIWYCKASLLAKQFTNHLVYIHPLVYCALLDMIDVYVSMPSIRISTCLHIHMYLYAVQCLYSVE